MPSSKRKFQPFGDSSQSWDDPVAYMKEKTAWVEGKPGGSWTELEWMIKCGAPKHVLSGFISRAGLPEDAGRQIVRGLHVQTAMETLALFKKASGLLRKQGARRRKTGQTPTGKTRRQTASLKKKPKKKPGVRPRQFHVFRR